MMNYLVTKKLCGALLLIGLASDAAFAQQSSGTAMPPPSTGSESGAGMNSSGGASSGNEAGTGQANTTTGGAEASPTDSTGTSGAGGASGMSSSGGSWFGSGSGRGNRGMSSGTDADPYKGSPTMPSGSSTDSSAPR
jgi:hypothetical protein